MKKILFLLLLIPFCATAQIQHLENFVGSAYCLMHFNIQLSLFEKPKGKLHKVVYKDPGMKISFEYDKKGQLVFARYYNDGTNGFELNGAEIINVFDKNGNLIGAKCLCYYPTSETELKQGEDVFLK